MLSSPPVPFAQVWRDTVANHPERCFLRFLDDDQEASAWSYEQFDDLVARTAARLSELGVGRGDAVHLCLRNSPAFVMVWLACARLGAWMVPVDPASTARDIATQTRRTRPRVGIAAASRADAYRQGAGSTVPTVLEVTETAADALAGSVLLASEGARPATPDVVEGADRLAVMFTSGTTSEPKGVVLTQANYGSMADSMARLVDLQSHHRWFVTLPLFHGNAQFYCFAPAIGAGASVALTSRFSASRWVEQARQAEATHASLFAAPIRMILTRTPDGTHPLALEHVWFAQSLGEEHYARFAAMTGVRPRQLYGMTETTVVVTCDLRPEPTHDTIGTPVEGREIYLADPADLSEAAEGEPGILMLGGERGVTMFEEYLDNPAANSAAFVEHGGREWFRTGDLVRRDGSGLYRFVGRVDDVIKVSGENVSLTEVEAALAQIPGVLEVAVVAVADPIRDQVPVAYAVPQDRSAPPTTEQLVEWARDNLTPAAQPREWHIIDELPRTSVGKIRRFKLGAAP